MYDIYKYNLIGAVGGWQTGDWYAALVNSGYTPNFATDVAYSAISSHVVGSPVALASLAIDATGFASANSVNFGAISSGSTIKSIVVYYNNGVTTFLGLYYDTGTGLPITTSGAAIEVDWNAVVGVGELYTL